jgi:hypothetical protein
MVEWDIVEGIVNAHTRKERALKYEHLSLVDKRVVNRPEIERRFEAIGSEAEEALAFKALSQDSNILRQLDRHETRLRREIESGWRQLDHVRNLCPPAANSPEIPAQFAETNFQNEPIPINEHPSTPALEPIGQPADSLAMVHRKTEGQKQEAPTKPQQNTPHPPENPVAANSSLATRHLPLELTTDHRPLTTEEHHQPLTTEDSPLATRHSPLVKAA